MLSLAGGEEGIDIRPPVLPASGGQKKKEEGEGSCRIVKIMSNRLLHYDCTLRE